MSISIDREKIFNKIQHIIVYVENLKESTRITPRTNKWFHWGQGMYYRHRNQLHPCVLTTKCSGNLKLRTIYKFSKEKQYLYDENHKLLMKEIKDLKYLEE